MNHCVRLFCNHNYVVFVCKVFMRETHQGDAIVPVSGNLYLLVKEDDETGF